MEKGGGVPLQARGEAGQGSVGQCGAGRGSLMYLAGHLCVIWNQVLCPLCNIETAVFSQIHFISGK